MCSTYPQKESGKDQASGSGTLPRFPNCVPIPNSPGRRVSTAPCQHRQRQRQRSPLRTKAKGVFFFFSLLGRLPPSPSPEVAAINAAHWRCCPQHRSRPSSPSSTLISRHRTLSTLTATRHRHPFNVVRIAVCCCHTRRTPSCSTTSTRRQDDKATRTS